MPHFWAGCSLAMATGCNQGEVNCTLSINSLNVCLCVHAVVRFYDVHTFGNNRDLVILKVSLPMLPLALHLVNKLMPTCYQFSL